MTSQTSQQITPDLVGVAIACPTVIRMGTEDVVVLGSTSDGWIEAWQDGAVVSYPPDTIVEGVNNDLAQSELALRRVLAGLNAACRAATAAICNQADHHAILLAEIRDYAIEAHRDGDICHDGLNEFLRTFQLAEYNPHLRVSYTIAGSYTVATADEAAIRVNASDALAPVLDDIDDIVEGSANYEVEVLAIRPLCLDDEEPSQRVEFALQGSYEVDRNDPYEAEYDGRNYLRLDTDAGGGLVPDSLSYAVDEISASVED